jgi:hypothetical protein
MLQKFFNRMKKIILDIYASKVFQWHKERWIWTNFISYTFFSNISEYLIHGRNYFSGQLNSFLLKEIGLQGKLLPEGGNSLGSNFFLGGT